MSSIILSILSAVLLSLSLSSFNLWQLGWCGFIPLFAALENKSLRQSWVLAYFCGIIFWSLTVYWLIHITFIGQAVLILYLAVYFGIFGAIVYLRRYFSLGKFIFFIPCSWVLLEYLRSYLFTGFPWALTGFSQYRILPVIQVADISGAWGVSFLVVLVNFTLYLALRKQLKKKDLLICILMLLLILGYGFYRLNYKFNFKDSSRQLKVSVIQGNIPQDLKWNKQAIGFIENNYKELTVAAAKDNPGLIIWPEAAVPGLWGEDQAEFNKIFSLCRRVKTNLLTGTVSHLGRDYFNSALFINQQGEPGAIYHKLHRVPFGEYIPLKNILPFLKTIVPIGDIEAGKDYMIFRQPADFGVLICFEDLFPGLSRQFIKRGAKFLVNITNDAWYKEGSAPYQHFAASVFRAVENHVYLARAANTGISGFIDPFGRLLSIVQNDAGKEIFVKGYRTQNISLDPIGLRRTFYNRYGDLFVIFCLLFNAGVIIFIPKNKK